MSPLEFPVELRMKALQIVRAMREKIAQGWCQGHAAEDADGNRVIAASSRACRFCVIGAFSAVTGSTDGWRGVLGLPQGGWEWGAWNDDPSRTQAEVLAELDRRAEALEAEGW